MDNKINVFVVGAGFGGLSTAISLARIGCKVHVYELSKDLSRQGQKIIASSKRVNLTQDHQATLSC